jgi:hypothetical protein
MKTFLPKTTSGTFTESIGESMIENYKSLTVLVPSCEEVWPFSLFHLLKSSKSGLITGESLREEELEFG